jgi:hypothetical protein
MKSLITILCLLCLAGSAYAEAYQVPGSYKETTTEVTVQQEDGQAVSETTKTTRKWFRRRHKDYNPTNTYWNFGRPPFWTGTI